MVQSIQECTRYEQRLAHEMRNTLATLRAVSVQLDADKKNEFNIDIYRFISETSRRYQLFFRLHPITDPMLRSILFQKTREAEENGIRFHFSIPNPGMSLPVNQYDYSSLLQNLLSNAFEAAVLHRDPTVTFQLYEDSGLCVCKINNSVDETLLQSLNLTLFFVEGYTTKPDAARHGLGLSVVKELLRKYHGTIEYAIADSMVCLTVRIPHDPSADSLMQSTM